MAEENAAAESTATPAEGENAVEGQTAESETPVLGGQTEADPKEGEASEGEKGEANEEGKGDEPKEGEDPKEDAKPLKAEDYDFTLPDGFAPDETLMGEFKEFAAGKQFSKEDAQELMDFHVKTETKRAEEFKNMQAEWKTQAEQDKEIGGSNYEQNLAVANQALSKVGTPELTSLIDSSGFGNHPEVIRLFYKIGVAIGEDKVVTGANAGQQADTKDPVNFYSNSNMK